MATTHIFEIGRIDGGAVDSLLAPRRQQPVCSDDYGCRCYAYSHGYDDAKAGSLPEPLYHVSAKCCITRYMAGHRDGLVAMEARRKPAPDGSLQRAIDHGHELHELEDARIDEEFVRRGC